MPITDVVKITQTNEDVYALKKDGTVWTWQTGQIRGVKISDYSTTPKQVAELSGITNIYTSFFHAVAIDNQGKYYLRKSPPYSPGDVMKVNTNIFNAVAFSDDIEQIIAESDSFETDNPNNTYLNEYTSQLNNLKDITDIVYINSNAIALRKDGTVWASGDNTHGNLGADYVQYTKTPVKVQGLENIQSIVAGEYYCFAINDKGNLYVWGENGEEELFPTEFHKNQKDWHEVKSAIITLNIDQPTIYVNNEPKQIPAPPMMIENTTMIPIREVIEGLGGTVEWDEENQQVIIHLDDTVLSLSIGKTESELNGTKDQIETAPQMINDKTYMPLRYICESIGANVFWEEQVQKISITY